MPMAHNLPILPPEKFLRWVPDSDGEPRAETDSHRLQMIYLLDALEEYFREEPRVYVTGNLFLYYRDELDKLKPVSPDVFVVKNIEKKRRRSYRLEKEGRAPDIAIEIVSVDTKLEDLGVKHVLYADLGIREYFVFAPLPKILDGQLRGFRLEGKEYLPMLETPLRSEALDLDLVVEKRRLRLYDRKTGEYLRSHKQSEADRRAAEAKARIAEAQAQIAEAKTVQEAQARAIAEAELARLGEELTKLKSGHA